MKKNIFFVILLFLMFGSLSFSANEKYLVIPSNEFNDSNLINYLSDPSSHGFTDTPSKDFDLDLKDGKYYVLVIQEGKINPLVNLGEVTQNETDLGAPMGFSTTPEYSNYLCSNFKNGDYIDINDSTFSDDLGLSISKPDDGYGDLYDRIMIIGNGYPGTCNYFPGYDGSSQSQEYRAIYYKSYWYDSTAPNLDDMYVVDKSGKKYDDFEEANGEWFNGIPVKFKAPCNDKNANAKPTSSDVSDCSVSPVEVNINSSTNDIHTVTITDMMDNTANNQKMLMSNGKSPNIGIDMIDPILTHWNNDAENVIYFSGSNSQGKNIDLSNSNTVSILADKYKLKFKLADRGNEGEVSGIKKYGLKVKSYDNDKICYFVKDFDKYNPDIDLTKGDQYIDIELDCDITESNKYHNNGSYEISLILEDWAGNIRHYNKNIDVFPNINLADTSLVDVSPDRNKMFANNVDRYEYKLKIEDIYGNPLYNRNIKNIDNPDGINNKIFVDMVDEKGGNAMSFHYDSDLKTNRDGEFIFEVSSVTPGVFDEKFKFEIPNWDNNYNQDLSSYREEEVNGIDSLGEEHTNSFLKLFYGEFYFTDQDFNEIDMQIGEENRLVVSIKTGSNLNIDYKMEGFLSETIPTDTVNYVLTGSENENLGSSRPKKIYFDTTMNYIGHGILGTGNIKTSPHILYKIGGEDIKYHLGSSTTADDNTMYLKDIKLMGVKIIGMMQGQGRQSVYGIDPNATNVSTSDVRNIFRKRASLIIRGLSSGEKSGTIHYKEGDLDISDLSYDKNDTLVIKNGNLIIDQNVDKNLGIMLIRDDLSDRTMSNVYVKPNVTYIKAAIFAEGGFVSADVNGDPFDKNDIVRTNSLSDQLVLEGSIFTWNTIGGALLSDEGNYVLPYGNRTDDVDEAITYDLNYIRRGNGILNGDKNEGYDDPFIIKFNPSILNNPPTGFGS
ncbi:hypothetical protein [Candidatus Vampirococcus lugosii]|uniref:Uncharacterized protein n=1 Tax=Candidatus Vampirococcus lugosii TaxID=2789015 RepID=A0ABS5QQX1_9BACT|nr:hypothetical protein [Candidatus Vampirococcus lugosii]MBS8122539.1 hypothetical protein [Candidatus Vampirococcus lugosii]